MAPFDTEGVLPNDGLLSFFYDAVTQSAWGFDPADYGSASVLYTPAHVTVESRQFPADLGEDGVFKGLPLLRPQSQLSFAPWESFDIEALGMTRDEGFAYAKLFNDQDAIVHRLIALDSASCRRLRVVLVEGREEGKPGGLHDVGGGRPDRDSATRQLHLEFDLSDRLAARAD